MTRALISAAAIVSTVLSASAQQSKFRAGVDLVNLGVTVVDKQGKPLPAGTLRMSQKGNDLVRCYLWNAVRSAIVHNPAIRTLYRRLRALPAGSWGMRE